MSFGCPLNSIASITRSSAVPGRYQSRTPSPALLRPKPAVIGEWKPVTSSKATRPPACRLTEGSAHFLGSKGSSLKYQPGPKVKAEEPGLNSSIQSLESYSG